LFWSFLLTTGFSSKSGEEVEEEEQIKVMTMSSHVGTYVQAYWRSK
jgi:hypothetical protein